jgi:FtsP/CotA-like multicopper oxidase with cupredoxin domain
MPFSVNGRLQPKIVMRPGEVQLFRIVDTSSRSGAFIVGFSATNTADPKSAGFNWKQLAQDGVQFAKTNYDAPRNTNPQLLLAAGNRADLLIKAPDNQTGQAQMYNLLVRPAVNGSQTKKAGTEVPLIIVQVDPGPTMTGKQSEFISGDDYPGFPEFLSDIPTDSVKTTKTVVFETAPPKDWAISPQFAMHSIDGKKFDGNVGQVVLLNTVEEWKIVNRTVGPQIDHPFHIHINPFQILEVFDPRQTVPSASDSSKLIPKYVFSKTPVPEAAQCYLDPSDSTTWKDCHGETEANRIWWDVFPIPAAVNKDAQNKPIIDPRTGQQVVVPGYFRMRSRFVDYAGQYVIHCHILAHEDRGMMTIVEVVPFTTAYSHQ